MADLSRVLQKIFGISGGSTEFGQIGSDAAGSPTTTKDLTTIQSLDQYLGGLFDLTDGGSQPPRLEDFNSLFFLITSQLSYLFQKGIPEWIATENYYGTKSIVQVAGAIYRSVTDSLNHNPTTDDGTYWEEYKPTDADHADEADHATSADIATTAESVENAETIEGLSLSAGAAGTYGMQTINENASWIIPAGLYMITYAAGGTAVLQIYSGSNWLPNLTGTSRPPATGLILSDGINYRITAKDTNASIYYRKIL